MVYARHRLTGLPLRLLSSNYTPEVPDTSGVYLGSGYRGLNLIPHMT